MPLDRLVLILVCVVVAAGLTIWLGALLAATVSVPVIGLAVLVPVGLIAFILWRVIAERLTNREDDHYDRIEK